MDIVVNNLDYDWNWKVLSRNKNITWDIIVANPEYPWSLRDFIKNPNFSFRLAKDNLKCDWGVLSNNPHILFSDIINSNNFKSCA